MNFDIQDRIWRARLVAEAHGFFEREALPCHCCGKVDDGEAEAALERAVAIHHYHPEFPKIFLCERCACILANGFSYCRGGGEFLTPGEYGFPASHPRTGSERSVSTGVRNAALERDGYRCGECGVQKDLTVRLIKPRRQGGEPDLDNLRTICRPCGYNKGPHPEAAR